MHRITPFPVDETLRARYREREQSKAGLHNALPLIIQETLGNAPEIIFQDPAYSDTEKSLLSALSPNGKIKVVDDPDAWGSVDQNILIVAPGVPDAILLRLDDDNLSLAMIGNFKRDEEDASQHGDREEVNKALAEDDGIRFNPRMAEVLASYEDKKIAPANSPSLGMVYGSSKYWFFRKECS